MPLHIPASKTVSDLLIDADKDWLGYNITNLGSGAHDLNAKLNLLLAHKDRHILGGADEINSALALAAIPNLPASIITSGVLNLARIPAIDDTRIPDLETLSYGGAFALAQIPTLDADALANAIRALYESNFIWWFENGWGPTNAIDSAVGGTGAVSWETERILLSTGATIDSYALVSKIIKKTASFPNSPSWDKVRRFKAWVRFIDFGVGSPTFVVSGDVGNTGESDTRKHIGFKVKTDQYLYATVGDGSAETEYRLPGMMQYATYEKLEVVFTPGVDAKFYVEDELEAIITTNLPSGSTDAEHFLRARIHNSTSGDKELEIYRVRVLQEP